MNVTDGRPADAIPVSIFYRNWRGVTAVRQIIPQTKEGHGSHMWFGATDWHPEPQWLLHAVDVEKGEARDFAVADIKAWGQAAVDALLAANPPVPDGVREAFEAAKLQELFVDGDKADVYTRPYGSCFINEFEMVARCSCGDLWQKRAVAIARGLNWIGSLISAKPDPSPALSREGDAK